MRCVFLCVVLLFVGCTIDIHYDSEAAKKPPAEAPIPTEEFTDSHLDGDAMARAKAHGWEVVSSTYSEDGTIYHLRRKICDREETPHHKK